MEHLIVNMVIMNGLFKVDDIKWKLVEENFFYNEILLFYFNL
jgi:hypothetical protein